MSFVAFATMFLLAVTPTENTMPQTVYSFTARSIAGKDIPLSEYKGKVLLIVNTASQCGYTPQYEGLEKLYKDFGAKGFFVLGFPCNQFGGQEPGTEADIQKFCAEEYKVTFPMFAKIDVNGDKTHPLYNYLKGAAPGVLGTEAIKWNFTKFLVDKEGKFVKRYGSSTEPKDIAKDIEALLAR